MNFLPAEAFGFAGAKTIGVRPEHLVVSPEKGDWKGKLVHLEHLGADTNIYIETEKAGLLDGARLRRGALCARRRSLRLRRSQVRLQVRRSREGDQVVTRVRTAPLSCRSKRLGSASPGPAFSPTGGDGPGGAFEIRTLPAPAGLVRPAPPLLTAQGQERHTMAAQPHFVIVGGGTAGWIAAFIIQDSDQAAEARCAAISVVESTQDPDRRRRRGDDGGVPRLPQALRHRHLRVLPEDRGHLQARHPARGLAAQGLHLLRPDRRSAPGDRSRRRARRRTISTSMRSSAGKPVQDMHLFGPLLERKKAPWAPKAGRLAAPARAVPPRLPFRPVAGGQVPQGEVGGRRDRRQRADRRRARRRERRHHRAGVRGRAAARGRFLHRRHRLPQAADRQGAATRRGSATRTSCRSTAPCPSGSTSSRARRSPTTPAPGRRKPAGCGRSRRRPATAAATSIPTSSAPPTRRMPRSSGCSAARSRCAATSGSRSAGWRRRGSATCVAVGLSSSFLEPLESTSIHGTIVQMMMFAGQYLRDPAQMTQALRDDYNRRVGRQVDDFRTFVNTHYVTERDDTPFWREVRANRIHPETKERLARWQTEMPRHEHFPQYLVRAAAHRDAAALSGARRARAARPGGRQGGDGPRPQAARIRARDRMTAWSRNTSRPRPGRWGTRSFWRGSGRVG